MALRLKALGMVTLFWNKRHHGEDAIEDAGR